MSRRPSPRGPARSGATTRARAIAGVNIRSAAYGGPRDDPRRRSRGRRPRILSGLRRRDGVGTLLAMPRGGRASRPLRGMRRHGRLPRVRRVAAHREADGGIPTEARAMNAREPDLPERLRSLADAAQAAATEIDFLRATIADQAREIAKLRSGPRSVQGLGGGSYRDDT